jgi:hypothetical protein
LAKIDRNKAEPMHGVEEAGIVSQERTIGASRLRQFSSAVQIEGCVKIGGDVHAACWEGGVILFIEHNAE